MEENRYGINWLGLFIKVIVFVVIVLLAIWLISKFTLKNKGLSFEENNKKFQDATVEYFKKNLPDKGNTSTVTLNQLISWDYLEELKNEEGKKCDVRNSKSKIEVVEDYYSIKTILVCGNKSETTYIKLGNNACTDCDIKVEGLKEVTKEQINNETKSEESNTSTNVNTNTANNSNETSKGPSSANNQSTTNNQTTVQNQTILYEYVKEVVEYSDWYIGKVTGKDIENSTKKMAYSNYCKIEEYTYRTVGFITEKMNYSYKLELTNLDNVSNVEIESDSYFTGLNDYQKYLNKASQDLQMEGAKPEDSISLPNASSVKNASLDSDNFTYTVSDVYKENGKYYVDIKVKVKNLNGVTPYYTSKIKSNVYYVPIKFTVSYVNKDNCVIDLTSNSNIYSDYTITKTWNENVDIYRYKIKRNEYVYSATPVEGYTKTGKTKLAG